MKKSHLVLAALLLSMVGAVSATEMLTRKDTEYRPTGKGQPEVDPTPGASVRNQAARKASSNGISYHGGPVMAGVTVNMYYIWYGNWSSYSTAQTILRDLARGLDMSPIYNTNSTYYNASNVKVTNRVALSPTEYTDNYSQGTALTDAGVAAVVARAIGTGTPDVNGIYFVLTSPDVQETSGFGSQYCGWHTYTTINNKAVKYSFVGNPLVIAPSGCGVRNPSPNGDGGADAMASVIYHELVEAVSDPQLNAWYDTRGYENADKCAWTYGTTFTAPNGAIANVTLGSRPFLIQRNWVNASGGYCATSY